MMSSKHRLHVLFEEIADSISRTVASMEGQEGDAAWLCKRGCSGCCESLGAPMQIREAEWLELDPAIRALPDASRIHDDIRAQQARYLEDGPGRGYICPMLDAETGACRVYEARPIACRAYGYYADAPFNFWCEDLDDHVAEHELKPVQGNYPILARRADEQLQAPKSICEWLEGSS